MIPYALMAYRVTKHSTTGFTPNYMMFGREIRKPVDLVAGLPPDSDPAPSVPEYVLQMREHLRSCHQMCSGTQQTRTSICISFLPLAGTAPTAGSALLHQLTMLSVLFHPQKWLKRQCFYTCTLNVYTLYKTSELVSLPVAKD